MLVENRRPVFGFKCREVCGRVLQTLLASYCQGASTGKRLARCLCLVISLFSLSFTGISYSLTNPSLDGWGVNNGDIAAPCPTQAISCLHTVTDNGFMMRQVIMPSSAQPGAVENYWQFVMTDPNATGTPDNDPFSPTGLPFSNESIIRADNAGNSTTVNDFQLQKTIVAESVMSADSIEDRWSQVSRIDTGAGYGISFEEDLTQIDWSAGPNSPDVLFDSVHKAKGALGNFGGVKEFNQVLTQDIWQGTDMTQKFQYQVDRLPRKHTAGRGAPILPGGTNGGDLTIGGSNRPLVAAYVGQSVANGTNPPSLFSYTAFRSHLSSKPETTSNVTTLSTFESANPAVNLNRFFTFYGRFPQGPDPLFPLNVFSINPSINTPPPLVTPTPWASGPPTEIAVTALNNNVASTLSGGAGTGGPPIDLGGWRVENGVVIFDPCPHTVICSIVVSGQGFVLRSVYVLADGGTYYQTVITDPRATGNTTTAPVLTQAAVAGEKILFPTPIPVSQFTTPLPPDPFVSGALAFANETFIKRGGGGVSNRTQVADTFRKPGRWIIQRGKVAGVQFTSAEVMAQRATINTGWAQGVGAAPVVELKQIIGIDDKTTSNNGHPNPLIDPFLPADGMFLGQHAGSQFDYTMASNGGTDYTVVGIPTQHKPSGFYMRKIDGGVQTTTHALTDPFLVPGGTNDGNIAWNAGDTLQALWWGETYSFYTGWVRNGFTAYTNLTTGDRTSRAQALSRPNGGPASSNGHGTSPNPPAPWASPFDTPAPPSMNTYLNGVIWPDQTPW